MSKWVSCDERLPEPCVLVLTAIYGSDLIVPFPGESLADAVDRIFSAPGHTSISFIGEDGLWCDGFFGGPEIVAPSYWMEFPTPPPNPKANRQENGELAEALGDMFDRVLGEETMEEMTNTDRIRSMTDEELAMFLHSFEWGHFPWTEKRWLDWLKQEVSAPPQKKPLCDDCKHAIDGVVDDFATVFCAVRLGYFGQVTECKDYAPREVSDNG